MENPIRSTATKKKTPPGLWAVLFILLAAACAPQQSAPTSAPAQASVPDEISVTQAAARRDQGAFILDVRQPEEWNTFHIPESTLIPLGELPNRLKLGPKDKEIIVVCRSGNRSQQGRDILRKAGYTNVTSMAGGVTEWQKQGLPIATGP